MNTMYFISKLIFIGSMVSMFTFTITVSILEIVDIIEGDSTTTPMQLLLL